MITLTVTIITHSISFILSNFSLCLPLTAPFPSTILLISSVIHNHFISLTHPPVDTFGVTLSDLADT